MTLFDAIQSISENAIANQPSVEYGTVTKFYENTVTVKTDEDQLLENILCVSTPKIGCACILVPVGEEFVCVPLELDIEGGSVDIDTSFPSSLSDSHVPSTKLVKNSLDTKQATLVSGTNIKTINNTSLLGSGNITIQGGGGSVIGTGSFSIDDNGHLIVELPDSVDNPYYINSNGHLIYDTRNTHNGE